jgi:hypothetical protein
MLCGCRQCLRDRKDENPPGSGWPTELTMMILCPTCGNKRCPHATDHRHACTGSNDTGQVGSAYENCKPHNAEVRGASRLAGEASSREAATSAVVLERGGRDV